MKVISIKICPFVQRVTALLAAKQVDYQVEYIDLNNPPQWFREVSPHEQVPLLITTENEVLFESDAIVEYVDEVCGESLFSLDPVAKARERAWAYLASKHYLTQCGAQRSDSAKTLAQRAEPLRSAFKKIGCELGEGTYIKGDTMGMVDIAWLPLLHRAALIEKYSGYDFLADFPRLKQWQAAILSTNIPTASVAEDFDAQFSAFYLPASTYLGGLARSKDGAACAEIPQCTAGSSACCG